MSHCKSAWHNSKQVFRLPTKQDVRFEEVFEIAVETGPNAGHCSFPISGVYVKNIPNESRARRTPLPNCAHGSTSNAFVNRIPQQPRQHPEFKDQRTSAGGTRAIVGVGRNAFLQIDAGKGNTRRRALEGDQKTSPEIVGEMQQLVIVSVMNRESISYHFF